MAFRSAASLILFTSVLILSAGCSREPKKDDQVVAPPPPVTPEPEKKVDPPKLIAKADPKTDPKTDPKSDPKTDLKDPMADPKKKKEDTKEIKVPDPMEEPDPGKGKDPKETKGGKDKEKKPVETPAFVPPAEVLGKTYAEWKKQISSADPTRREEAMKQIRAFGLDKAYEALPDILADLKKHSSATPRDLSVCVNGTIVMTEILFLMKEAKKEVDPKYVADALVIYKRYMKDAQVILKTRAVQGVMALGPRSHEVIDEVMVVARDTSSFEIRKEGLIILGKMALEMKEIHPKLPGELRKALDDVNVQIRLLGMQSIVALKDRFDEKERKAMIDKIEFIIGPKGKEKDPVMQIFAYSSLMTITGETKGYIESVIAFTRHKDDAVKARALNAIAALELKGQIALEPVLSIAHRGDSWELRKEGLLTVIAISYDKEKKTIDPKVVTELLSAFGDEAPELRLWALEAMIKVKPALSKEEVQNAIVNLEVRARKEREPLVKIWAYATLVTLLDKITPAHMGPILTLLEHKDAAVRRQALVVIALGGKDAKPLALDGVLKTVKDTDTAIACAAIDTLPNLEATETLPMLRMLAADPKGHPDIIEAAGDAVNLLETIVELQKSQKKDEKK